jgi:membrane protease YdiL (CAAX protease family)
MCLQGIIATLPLIDNIENLNDTAIKESFVDGSRSFWLIYIAVIGPFAEELVYRGAIFDGLKKRSKVLAYVMSSFLFALSHVWIDGIFLGPKYFLLGLVYIPFSIALAYIYDRTNCFYYSLFIHMLNNYVVTSVWLS